MPIHTPINELFDIRHPIILAPMAGVSGGALAAAVSNAGGLGVIGGGYGDRDWLTRELDAAGNAPVGVGFITWSLAKQPDLLDLALERAPKAIFLSFGSIGSFTARIARSSARLIVQVQTVQQAREAAGEGAAVIVAQGAEAGGHGGSRATFPLVPAVVDAVHPLPVVAAGGIADGRGLAAALMLGAAGAVCGTVFYASVEALADPKAKDTLVAASGDETQRSSVFDLARGMDWPKPWTVRTLENAFSRRWGADLGGLRDKLAAEQRRYAEAREAGDFSTAAVIAGEAADLVRSVRPAAAIMADMVDGAAALLRDPPALRAPAQRRPV
ncbi:MAG: nitronate monooxygenase [Rhodospirillales bacterium]|nr:nitronate monooxygenase [Rhodospirillales bacterium]